MNKPLSKRILNRILHLMAQFGPGAMTLRPMLHRARGVTVGKGVFIGDQVMIENEYPEQITIGKGSSVAFRSTISAHGGHGTTKGTVTIKENVYIAPRVGIYAADHQKLIIGKGARIGPGTIITRNVPPFAIIGSPRPKIYAYNDIPLRPNTPMKEYKKGVRYVKS